MTDFNNKITNLQPRVATFADWRVGNDGQNKLRGAKRVVFNCADSGVEFATLVCVYDYSFGLRFDDGDMIDMSAYDAWLRDLRPA